VSAWEHESADLFRTTKDATAPTSADRERVRAKLAAKLGAAAVGAALTTTAKPAAGAAKLTLFGKIALPILVLGGAAAVTTHLTRAPASAPPLAVAPAIPHVEPSLRAVEPVTTGTISVDDLPSAAPSTTVVAKKAAPPAPGDPLEESRLVARIDAALRDGDASLALRLADEHARTFPDGVLVEEREGGRAIARCMSGSRGSGDAFLAAHPRSPMRGRIVAACGTKGSE
jgi:hypothetical protein